METTAYITRKVLRRGGPTTPAGFTLAELLVVIAIIALTLAMVVPSIHAMFTAKSDEHAEGTLDGLLSLARGVAIENQTYSLLHVQIGLDDECWAAVFKYDPATGKFVAGHFTCPSHPNVRENTPVTCPTCSGALVWDGLLPRKIEDGAAFGEVTRYVSGQEYQIALNNEAGWRGFTTFNVIFDPDGSLVTEVNGAAPQFDTEQAFFSASSPERIWDPAVALINETGVRVMTVFDYKIANIKADRTAYFNESATKDGDTKYLRGRFLVVNPYTGRLIRLE